MNQPVAADSDQPSWWSWPLLIVLFGACAFQTAVFGLALATGRLEIVGFSAVTPAGTYDPAGALLAIAVPLMWAIPGVVILRRADWHLVGWMLILCGIGFGLSFDMGSPVIWDDFTPFTRPWAAWISDSWGPYLSFIGMILLLSVFPDGLGPRRSAVRRWRIIRTSSAVVIMVVAAFASQVGGNEGNTFSQAYPNPTGFGFIGADPESGSGVILQALVLPILILLVSAVWSLWRRARTADGDAHRQYAWVLFPFGRLAGFTLLALVASVVLPDSLGDVAWAPVGLATMTIPVSFSIAMVRYRWFDIDRLVSRTVTYAVVAAVVIAVYTIPVLVLPEVLGLSGDLTVAGATLLAAAVFNPLRRRVQRVVGRRFNRSRYDAESVVSGFSEQLQSAVDLARVTESLGNAVGTTLHPAMVTVWYSERSS